MATATTPLDDSSYLSYTWYMLCIKHRYAIVKFFKEILSPETGSLIIYGNGVEGWHQYLARRLQGYEQQIGDTYTIQTDYQIIRDMVNDMFYPLYSPVYHSIYMYFSLMHPKLEAFKRGFVSAITMENLTPEIMEKIKIAKMKKRKYIVNTNTTSTTTTPDQQQQQQQLQGEEHQLFNSYDYDNDNDIQQQQQQLFNPVVVGGGGDDSNNSSLFSMSPVSESFSEYYNNNYL